MLTLLLVLDCFATGDFNDLSGDHFCLLAGKEEDGFGNVLRLDQLSHGDQRNNDLFKFHIDPSGLGGAGYEIKMTLLDASGTVPAHSLCSIC